MDADGEKTSVKLTIYNQTFSLRVAGNPSEVQRAANEVDELMHSIARSGNIDATRVAILACLHLQDRIYDLESELTNIREAVEDRTQALAGLLDSVMENPGSQS